MPPSIMGILNATPDSFASEGAPASVEQGLAMIAAGADILDIGGESTRPGAEPVPPAEEQRRVLPLIAALAGRGAAISIDTRNASTMAAAFDAGATIANDVSGLTYDPAAAPLVAAHGCRVVVMHSRGTPATMQQLTHYDDLITNVRDELAARVALAEEAGISRANIIVDVGFGFAKTAEQSLTLLRRLGEFRALGLPILVGVSRKSFIGRIGAEPDPRRRMAGSIAAALFALQQGADILRVHDVPATVQAVRVWRGLGA